LLNAIWLGLMLVAVLWAAFAGTMGAVKNEALASAEFAISFVIKLTGAMVLFLGLMRVAQEGGLLRAVARGLRPVLRRLFPDVPPEHPAMGAMIMNLASNVLGLGNAATPFGLKAMVELDRLNRTPGVASDSMILFLAINATSVSLFPLGVIAMRASLGSSSPDAIWGPTLLATTASTATAVAICLGLRRLPAFAAPPAAPGRPAPDREAGPEPDPGEPDTLPARPGPVPAGARLVIAGFALGLAVALALHVREAVHDAPLGTVLKDVFSAWFLPVFMVSLLLVGLAGRVRVYEAAVQGGREALDVAVRIVPFLVMILVAIGMLRASGALDGMVRWIDPVTGALGFPAEALPMALLRPLSGSGASGVMVEIMKRYGPDSFVGILVSAMNGSTETTFYVLTLYLGAARVRSARYALGVCLAGDLAGYVVVTAACHWLFGGLA